MAGSSPSEESAGFRFVFRPWRLLFGLLAGVGYVVLLQQYGVMTLSVGKLVMFALLGLALGVLMPTLGVWLRGRRRAAPHAGGGAP